MLLIVELLLLLLELEVVELLELEPELRKPYSRFHALS